jgi:hypothetical protein
VVHTGQSRRGEGDGGSARDREDQEGGGEEGVGGECLLRRVTKELPKIRRDDDPWRGVGGRWRVLAYVLTFDLHIRRDTGDSYRLPCGMYCCCHVTATGGNTSG